MKPNIRKAAAKAIKTLVDNGMDSANPDPMLVLKKLHNVLLMPSPDQAEVEHLREFILVEKDQDAFTLVDNENGNLRYIVVYKPDAPSFSLRLALAKELGHVILQHDGNEPEEVWMEEASCFAHHFLCPLGLIAKKQRINYRPKHITAAWELKSTRSFDSVEHLKVYIVNEQNKLNRYIGEKKIVHEDDVKLTNRHDNDQLTGWNNCCDVVLAGETIGYCGE